MVRGGLNPNDKAQGLEQALQERLESLEAIRLGMMTVIIAFIH